MFQQHYRHAIFNQGQHPYRHSLTEFSFTNPALPNVTNPEAAMNWILAVLYPQTKPAVATVAALPLVGNILNDYRVVHDDGDGKAASYRWEQREGEGAPSWHKIYDMDWGSDSILADFYNITQDKYVIRLGRSDKDISGNVITGMFAGQKIAGGDLTNQNLTLESNSFDNTGYVQTVNHFRPTTNNLIDLGTTLEKFRTGIFGTSLLVNTLSFTTGLITDSTGNISFGSDNLITTGNFAANNITATTKFQVGALEITDGQIIDGSGTIDFVATDITTTGQIIGGVNSQLADFTFTNGSLISASATINFGANNLLTTGNVTGAIGTYSQVDGGNLRLSVNTLSSTNVNGNISISPNGTGIVDILSSMQTLAITSTGVVTVTGQINIDNLRFDNNTISTTNLNGNISLIPNGTGEIEFGNLIFPSVTSTQDIGKAANLFRKLFLNSAINDGTLEITVPTLISLRDINVGATSGMTLFYDGTKWNASLPDTEITHNTLSGLVTGDAGHTQFVMLAGRAGGQNIIGGTAASENLTLESTSNVTKGTVQTKDHFTPFTNASFSGTWQGTDLGTPTRYFRDLYTKGELKGARLENFTFATLPSSSSQNTGRLAWTTDQKKVYVDNGISWQVAGVAKYINDESFDGVQLTKTVTVSANITDARNAVWALHDNANDFEQIFCTIKKTSATQVQIITNGALPAGSYRLIGIE
jgi:hypothetical protein